MTTLKDISENLNIDPEYDFPPNMMDIDIGDYTFTDVKQHDPDGFIYLYSNKDNNGISRFSQNALWFKKKV